MTKPLRLATVGTGYFSQFQYRAWKRIAEVQLVAVCNRNLEKAREFASQYGAAASFTSVEEMLTQAEPDLVDIITPPETHLAAIEAAAQHGVNVICQKPFCRNLAEAEQAVAIAEAAGITLIVHENFRFEPWYVQIRQVLDAGILGRIYQATFRLRPGDGQGERAYLDRQPYFRTMPRLLIHETGIHFIDVFRSLFGEVHSVFAKLRRLNPAIAGEDSGLVVLDMDNGVQAILDGNRLSDHAATNMRRTMGEMLIEGEKATLILNGDGRIFIRRHGTIEQKEIAYDWSDVDFGGDCVYQTQRTAIDALLGRRPVVNSGRDYLINLKIEEAAYASNDQGRQIVID